MGTQRVSIVAKIDYLIPRCILKDYIFVYLPYIEGLKGNLTDEYQAKSTLALDSYFSK